MTSSKNFELKALEAFWKSNNGGVAVEALLE